MSTGTPIPAHQTCRRRCRYRANIVVAYAGAIGGGVGLMLGGVIRKIVAEQLADALVLPKKIFVPLATDESVVPTRTLMDAQFAPPRALLRPVSHGRTDGRTGGWTDG